MSAPTLPFPETLELRREGLATAFEKRFDHPDLETGDWPFDDAVFVRGQPSLVAALLDRQTRNEVRRLLSAGGRITQGKVTLETRNRMTTREEFINELGRVINLARRLCAPRDPAARLAANAREDPVPGVRLRNLQLLVERFHDRAETRDALHAALEDGDAGVRLLAASALDPEGRPVLEALALDATTPEPVAVEALRALGSSLAVEQTLSVLDRSLRDHQPALALATIEVLGKVGGAEAVERLLTLATGAGEKLAAAAIRSLVATADPRATAAFVTALDHRSRMVRLAAVGALGQVGTVDAVPALRAAVSAHPADLGLRSAVATAVAAVQERATGAAPGQLALAEGQAGELALAEGEDGRVSLAGETTESPE